MPGVTMALSYGERLGPYEILEPIGADSSRLGREAEDLFTNSSVRCQDFESSGGWISDLDLRRDIANSWLLQAIG